MNESFIFKPVIQEDVNSRMKLVALGLGVLFAAIYIYQIIHRVFYHRLAKFPGSVLASVSTEWYVTGNEASSSEGTDSLFNSGTSGIGTYTSQANYSLRSSDFIRSTVDQFQVYI